MGVDVSVAFVPVAVDDDDLTRAVASVTGLAESPVAVLLGAAGMAPRSVSDHFPNYTAVSLWGQQELGAAEFGATLSQFATARVLVLTVVDHALVGGYLVYEMGALVASEWTEGEAYLGLAQAGLAAAYGVDLRLSSDEKLSLTELLAVPARGLVVEGGRCAKTLSQAEVTKVFENDVQGEAFEPILAIQE